MIQQIYITDYLSAAASQPVALVESIVNHCPALLQAHWQTHAQPPLSVLFDALLQPTGQAATVSPVSKVLSASQTWQIPPVFCLLPVHLAMRRDTFSLQAVVPLPAAIYQILTQRLQQHFAEEFLLHVDPGQRFWWVQPLRQLQAECPWPQACLFQQAMHWQPQGPEAGLVRQWTNEIQMMLHQMASQIQGWPTALNSLWFASVGHTPGWHHTFDLVAGQGEVFAGFSALQLPALKAMPFSDMLKAPGVQQRIWIADDVATVDWSALNQALQQGVVKKCTLVIPFAERHVQIHYQHKPRWQFWHKPATLDKLLQQLEQSLPADSLR